MLVKKTYTYMKVHNLDSLRLKIRFGLTSSPDSDRLLQSKLRYTISCKIKKNKKKFKKNRTKMKKKKKNKILF